MQTIQSDEIKRHAREWGADLAGVADLELIRGIRTRPEGLLDHFTRAVSVGVRLNGPVLDMITDAPIPLYAHVHRVANQLLDSITFHLAAFIIERGYDAVPVPASEAAVLAEKLDTKGKDSLDWDPLTSSTLPSKAVARAAGLGWFGKSLLIVNPAIGPRFRHASVITTMPLTPDTPLKSRCGACMECVNACPVQAIRGLTFEGVPPAREEVLDFPRCRETLWLTFKNIPGVGYPICGVCMSVCPWGKRKGSPGG
ncbi:MAG: 4Fe-4S dicluster domain-containing protein [Alphaproteobacteria bacterium]|uniref:4Fe-4S dicluster domain-containing protein n=1 Tax=Candidatus Nitrobium versatile TaxID=2884831 RepID=A0A953SDU4_9BACT|nr:4Fe-4S dicluster domain-containing protein [Candidatus Nitrobium versatile]